MLDNACSVIEFGSLTLERRRRDAGMVRILMDALASCSATLACAIGEVCIMLPTPVQGRGAPANALPPAIATEGSAP
jgi:hypothetical protein